MKNRFRSVRTFLLCLGLALAWLSFDRPAAFAVGFTITPAAISNTYNGSITFQVTGLTNNETVVVQKFLDAHGTGTVVAGDLLWQQFTLTDGTNFQIGGVTNINVPGDLDATPGQITAKLYPQADFSQVIAANYLFVLSSPAGHFSPITNSFTVTNLPYAQKFTGTVVSSGVPVPYASILLFPGSGSGGGGGPGNPSGGAVANGSGAFVLPAPAGTYTLVAFKTNFVASLTGASGLVLGGGAGINTNLSLIPATKTISGKVADAATGRGLPGLLVAAMTQTGLLGISDSDSNGNFTIGVTANDWKLALPGGGLALHGYVGPQNKMGANTATGSVAGLTIALPQATALFYGTVKDSLGHPLPGEVAVDAYDNNNGQYQSDGYTDAGGNYVTAAIGGLGGNDPWYVSIDNASSFPNYIFSQPAADQQNGGTNLSVGAAVPANITALLATNAITGNVKFNGGNLAGAGVDVYGTINGVNYNLNTVDTDNNGNYSVAVANGTWNVYVKDCGCSDSDSLNNLLGSTSYQDPAGGSVTIQNDNATVNFNVPAVNNSGEIFGYVTDADGDPVTGVTVYANAGGGTVYSSLTDNSGYYSFNVGNGNWDVTVDCDGLTALNYQCVSGQNVTVAGGSVEQDFVVEFAGSSGPLGITTTTLPDGLAGGSYSQLLSASGGQPPYTWSLTPGSLALPGGLNLSTGGDLSGTPAGVPFGGTTYYFSVRVTDQQNNTADQLLSLTIYPALTMASLSLPNGTNGRPYNVQVLVSGGDPFSLGDSPDGYSYYFPSGSLPPGLNFSYGTITSSNEYFVISGTPTNNGTYHFTLGAEDADGNSVQENFSIAISSSALQISTASLSNATVGIAYSYQLQASGGTPPYTWTIANGSQPLPAGFTLSTNGLLAGVPATSGINNFIVRLTDHNSLTTTHPFALAVNPKPGLGSPGKISGTQFEFLLVGATGQNYTLQMSTNLSRPQWTSLFTTNSTTTNSFIIVDPNATNQQRYYRVLIGP